MKRYETITIPIDAMAEFLAGGGCNICPRKKECDSLIDFNCWNPEDWLVYLNEEVSDEKV